MTGTKDFHVRLLDSKTGQPHWDFSPAGEGSSEFGQAVTSTREDGHLIVLNEGANVRKLNSKTGAQIWHWKAEAGSATTYFSVVEANGFTGAEDVVYVLGLQRGIAAFSLEVVALESATGKHVKTFNIKSKIDKVEDVLTLGGGSPLKNGYVAWLEQDYLKVLNLGTDKTTQSTLKVSICSSLSTLGRISNGILYTVTYQSLVISCTHLSHRLSSPMFPLLSSCRLL